HRRALYQRRGPEDLRQVVHAEDPAEGIEPLYPDRRRAEERVRQAFGFAGSGFLQVNVDLRRRDAGGSAISSRNWPEICMDVVPINANLGGVARDIGGAARGQK